MLSSDQIEEYNSSGCVVVSGLFFPNETETLREHYMALRAGGVYPGDFDGVDANSDDPLKRYPRMIHMHRWDDASLRWLLDKRLDVCMTGLLGLSPIAVQTMLYFKPPGARGQALHQDQFYLRVQPGTCIAAWMALDDCDEANGCMQVVPGTHELPVLCTVEADTQTSFTDVTVPLPQDVQAVPVVMKAGDVLFFNGSVVHGSYPNTSGGRFRRALIGHYVTGDAQRVGGYYHPALRMDGTPVQLEEAPGGGPCGVWTEKDGRRMVDMVESRPMAAMHE